MRDLYYIITILAICLLPSAAKAQDTPAADVAPPERSYSWFIQLGAGVSHPFVERGINGVKAPGKAIRTKNMTTTYNIGVGCWLSPYLALRLNGLGGALHWDNPAIPNQSGWSKAKHANLNIELMWDMCNSISGTNPRRFVSIVPFVGIGADYTWGLARDPASNVVIGNGRVRNTSWTLPVSAGVQLRLRVCSCVDFFAEVRGSLYGDNWNGCAYGNPVDANVTAVGGFDFNIGGHGRAACSRHISPKRISGLNKEINMQRCDSSGNRAAAHIENFETYIEKFEK